MEKKQSPPTIAGRNLSRCASVPNFRVLETDYEDVTWKDEVFTSPPVIEDGMLILPDTPGWGTDINEEALAKYPPNDTMWIGAKEG